MCSSTVGALGDGEQGATNRALRVTKVAFHHACNRRNLSFVQSGVRGSDVGSAGRETRKLSSTAIRPARVQASNVVILLNPVQGLSNSFPILRRSANFFWRDDSETPLLLHQEIIDLLY